LASRGYEAEPLAYACDDSFLTGRKYPIHDRDPLYTEKFDNILRAAGLDPVKLPPRSPDFNAHVERFVRSINEECLDHQPLGPVAVRQV
jgi:transposase InsO family protein